MANDPNRDLLPVKEDCSYKTLLSDRISHQILTKLSRCELEDRFHRSLDEQIQLKKLINNQEEKIKRLGTKLLRLINERKNGRKYYEQPKETEDLHLRIIELEHENYSLKDKNIVLKQQLSNHSRHLTHRSPIRSNHTSPLMSMRQPAQPNNSEVTYESTSKNNTLEIQLQEAETLIKHLNEEIKTLRNKINELEEALEKTNYDNRKTKVSENIELIRLQRSIKLQANQIRILQEEVKNSQYNQKCLREELEKAYEENYKALYIISEKQNKIIELYNKLEEKKLDKIEEGELKQRIDDLLLERNSLKERSDLLMKTISVQAQEAERVTELKKTLAEEIQKKEIAERELESTKKLIDETKLKESTYTKIVSGDIKPDNHKMNIIQKIGMLGKMLLAEYAAKRLECPIRKTPASNEVKKKDSKSTLEMCAAEEVSCKNFSIKCVTGTCTEECKTKCSEINYRTPEVTNHSVVANGRVEALDSNAPGTAFQGRNHSISNDIEEKKRLSQRMNLEREVNYLREMLRNQTARCEAQQLEISRLMSELKMNEEKCNDTLKKLDFHLKVFQNLEVRNKPNELKADLATAKKSFYVQSGGGHEEHKKSIISRERLKTIGHDKKVSVQKNPEVVAKKEKPTKHVLVQRVDSKRRFVDQVFLDSSDEDNEEETFAREHFIKKLDELEDGATVGPSKNRNYECSEVKYLQESVTLIKPNSIEKDITNQKKRNSKSSGSVSIKSLSDSSFSSRKNSFENEIKDSNYGVKSRSQSSKKSNEVDMTANLHEIVISVVALQLEEGSSLLKDNHIKLLFIDFSFLDVKGEETETPDSLPKPKSAKKKCVYNFSKGIHMNEERKKKLKAFLNQPNFELIVFKVVTDSDEDDDFISEDVGVSVVTVEEFLHKISFGVFPIPVISTKDSKELVGTLFISIDASPGLRNF